VGAWIEIRIRHKSIEALPSHPVWVRGLKCLTRGEGLDRMESHPVWVRGLKLCPPLRLIRTIRSHPVWVRGLKFRPSGPTLALRVAPRVGAWIEISNFRFITASGTSHPVWVRGLKYLMHYAFVQHLSRTPCGCVD